MDDLRYQTGFANHFATESLPNALPKYQNSPQKLAYGLYAEQISGSPFTAPKERNLRSWLYRIYPSVGHSEFTAIKNSLMSPSKNDAIAPTQLRWNPLPIPKKQTNFIEGLILFASNGNIKSHQGSTVYLYACNRSMDNEFFYSADGELLIVPQQGSLLIRTELGLLTVAPEEILVIPRGIKFQVQLLEQSANGYVCENHGLPFRLPERGLIGGNGLANERDFLYPVAFFEDLEIPHKLVCKFLGQLWQCNLKFSPLNVVAWHGNYAPYKYDLRNFNTINTVSFDHADPSIFTVLTSPSAITGAANVDFVIFPERWSVAEHSFRPPYFHRNIMNELMGLIKGEYDAKAEGFFPGGLSIHNCMSAHGPDVVSYETAIYAELKPTRIENTLAFMFESIFCWLPSHYALSSSLLQKDYLQCWQSFKKHFHT